MSDIVTIKTPKDLRTTIQRLSKKRIAIGLFGDEFGIVVDVVIRTDDKSDDIDDVVYEIRQGTRFLSIRDLRREKYLTYSL